MVDRHDYVALEWVKGEIAHTLKQARVALDAYAQRPAADVLEQCLDTPSCKLNSPVRIKPSKKLPPTR